MSLAADLLILIGAILLTLGTDLVISSASAPETVAAPLGVLLSMIGTTLLVSGLLLNRRRRIQREGAGPPAYQTLLEKGRTRFVGYDQLETDATVTDVFPVAGQSAQADVFLEETPFYAERGGQTADTGVLTWKGATARVIDVQPQGEAIRHRVEVAADRLKPGDRVHAAVPGRSALTAAA